MKQPTLRDLLATPDVKTGFWVNEFMTPAIGHILKAANCDIVVFDIPNRQLRVELTDQEIEARLKNWKAPAPLFTTGVMAKYAKLVSSASLGAVTS